MASINNNHARGVGRKPNKTKGGPRRVKPRKRNHDENRNRRVDRALLGIPKEGIGFSNDAPIRMSPPRWDDAMWRFGGDQTIQLKMRYFLGAAGPGGH